MRSFVDVDGRRWTAFVDGSAAPAGAAPAVGWESILFESPDLPAQRIVYRPFGWLRDASEEELRGALAESEPVRATWGA